MAVALSELAVVALQVRRLTTGVRRRGRCIAGARLRPGERRCTKRSAAGQFQQTVAGTSAAVPFASRIGAKTLIAGFKIV